jgi:hypothetical protein
VQALDVADALVVPAGGMVDGAGVVDLTDDGAQALGIELAPALVEGHPHGYAGAVVKL